MDTVQALSSPCPLPSLPCACACFRPATAASCVACENLAGGNVVGGTEHLVGEMGLSSESPSHGPLHIQGAQMLMEASASHPPDALGESRHSAQRGCYLLPTPLIRHGPCASPLAAAARKVRNAGKYLATDSTFSHALTVFNANTLVTHGHHGWTPESIVDVGACGVTQCGSNEQQPLPPMPAPMPVACGGVHHVTMHVLAPAAPSFACRCLSTTWALTARGSSKPRS